MKDAASFGCNFSPLKLHAILDAQPIQRVSQEIQSFLGGHLWEFSGQHFSDRVEEGMSLKKPECARVD